MISNSAASLSGLAGLWLAFLFSLAIFSMIIGNHVLARVAQYVLVGASLGYVAVVALREVLQPRLFAPLLQGGATPGLWVPLLLGLLLLLAGGDHMLTQNSMLQPPLSLGRKVLRAMGLLPVALMLGVGVSVALIGVVQGTLTPQLWKVIQTDLSVAVSLDALITNWMAMLLTTATLLHLSINAAQDLAQQPRWMQRLLRAWIWVGKRAFWFVAGVIFARLAAARLSLLIARFEYFLDTLNATGMLNFVQRIWSNLAQ